MINLDNQFPKLYINNNRPTIFNQFRKINILIYSYPVPDAWTFKELCAFFVVIFVKIMLEITQN